jgi:hypothetical protein
VLNNGRNKFSFGYDISSLSRVKFKMLPTCLKWWKLWNFWNFLKIKKENWKFWNLMKILNFFDFLKILKFYEIKNKITIWLADWKWNLVSGWPVGKPVYTSREVYSLYARCTHSEVELRKCCLGQSEKSEIPSYLINSFEAPNLFPRKMK